MANKYYAVRKGRSTGVFFTWDQCKAQVDGFKGAQYKSFTNINEAEAFVAGGGSAEGNLPKEELESQNFGEDTAVAYVDGSYKASTREFSCGAVLFYKGEELHFSQKYDDPSLSDMRNVAGEIMGSSVVIAYCLENNIDKLVVYHDYEGIARWADGDWKTNKEGTAAYKEYCQNARKTMKISFIKVKGHSGDKYNDLADSLAKKALGI